MVLPRDGAPAVRARRGRYEGASLAGARRRGVSNAAAPGRTLNKSTLGNIEATLAWHSRHAKHANRIYLERVKFWRDFFPSGLGECLSQAAPNTVCHRPMEAGELIAARDPARVRRVRASGFNRQPRPGPNPTPRIGRFYPLNLLQDLDGFFAQDRRPFRVLAIDADELTFDINHPLAGLRAVVEARAVEFLDTNQEHGGRYGSMSRKGAPSSSICPWTLERAGRSASAPCCGHRKRQSPLTSQS